MTALERAARALAALQGAKWDARTVMETPSGEEPEEMREGFRDQARAVLLVLLNPMNVSLLDHDGTPRHFDDVLASILDQDD